jgi:hypothetical protein
MAALIQEKRRETRLATRQVAMASDMGSAVSLAWSLKTGGGM